MFPCITIRSCPGPHDPYYCFWQIQEMMASLGAVAKEFLRSLFPDDVPWFSSHFSGAGIFLKK
jgi:hypothetical protein